MLSSLNKENVPLELGDAGGLGKWDLRLFSGVMARFTSGPMS